MKRTSVIHGRHALRAARLAAARRGDIGMQALAIEHVAARLAGGFARVVDMATLREAVAHILPETDLGEFESIKMLPGFARAGATSLMRLWMSGLDETAIPDAPRMAAVAALDDAVRRRLPASVRPPHEIASRAIARVRHAPAILGAVTVEGMTDLHPVWREIMLRLNDVVPVEWVAGPREIPAWLRASGIRIVRTEATRPRLSAVSCATGRQEVIEALRWARSLMALGIPAHDIAVATTATADYDDHFATLAAEANLPIHFVHGLMAVNTTEGQAISALADVLLRGLSQKRIRRLVDLVGEWSPLLDRLPERWDAVIPPTAALTTIERWERAFDRKEDGEEAAKVVIPFLKVVSAGPREAATIGEKVLAGRALDLWRRALVDGPPTALDQTIQDLRVDDGVDPFSAMAYMNAEALATVPRKHVRLLGLTSRSWPRGISEDALIPTHVIDGSILDPLPLREVDRRDFETILATTSGSVVLSWARRDADGRELGVSAMVPMRLANEARRLRRVAVPVHAMSESDRLLARPDEFGGMDHAISAAECWTNWHEAALTAHDGLVSGHHPRLVAALSRFHSSTSIRLLLRDPMGFMWEYALGLTVPELDDEPLTIDARQFGNLVHDILRRAVESLEEDGGIATKSADRIRKAVDFAAYDAGVEFQITQPVPPTLIWHSTMARAVAMTEAALLANLPPLPGQATFVEVPFGGDGRSRSEEAPWDVERPVLIPGTSISIRGRIDRLDLSGDRRSARVTDYKSGAVPGALGEIEVAGGTELQRAFYGFAVKSLLGDDVGIESGLLYAAVGAYAPLKDAERVLALLADAVGVAVDGLMKGRCLPGIDAGGRFSDLAFALPANATATYLKRKAVALSDGLGDAAKIWGEA